MRPVAVAMKVPINPGGSKAVKAPSLISTGSRCRQPVLWSRFRRKHHAVGVIGDGEVFFAVDGRAVDGCKRARDAGWRNKNRKRFSHCRLEFIDQLNIQRTLQADGTGY